VSDTTGNIILLLGSDSVEIEREVGQPGRPKVSLKPAPETPAEWPKECTDLIADPANKLVVITTLGDHTKLIEVPKGQQSTWIERFNRIENITATAETRARMLAS
jgi:hypothetical protein